MLASPLFILLRRAFLPALCLMVIAFFSTHALFGPAGFLALDGIRAERGELQARNAELKQRKAELERDITLLDPRGADRDFADELIRRHLGVIRPDEIIVPLEPVPPADQPAG